MCLLPSSRCVTFKDRHLFTQHNFLPCNLQPRSRYGFAQNTTDQRPADARHNITQAGRDTG